MNNQFRTIRYALVAALTLAAILIHSPSSWASEGEEHRDYDLLHTIEVQLGDKNNQMRFFPGHILLTRGDDYKLVITNPSPVTHEFASLALIHLVETDKMEIFDKNGGLVAYIRGAIAEVELLPGGRIEWAFRVMKSSDNVDLFCDIPGHFDAGMIGKIEIREPK